MTYVAQGHIFQRSWFTSSSIIFRFCTQSVLKPHRKSPETRINAGFPSSIFLLKLANKILSLYFLVLVLWFYLVLYVFHCPKSIDCTERCYQFVIMIVLSITFSLKRLKQLLGMQIPAHLTTHSAKSRSVFPDITERVSASADQ